MNLDDRCVNGAIFYDNSHWKTTAKLAIYLLDHLLIHKFGCRIILNSILYALKKKKN